MSYDEIFPGGPRLIRGGGHAPGTDSLLLFDFARTIRARHIADLGCGGGILTLLLARCHPNAQVTGVELLPELAELCRDNLSLNGVANARVVTGDLRDSRSLLGAGEFDLVVSNPPYFPLNSGRASPDPIRAVSRDERGCTLGELCAAAGCLCRYGGAFALVHRPERLAEVFAAMSAAKIEPKRLLLAQHTRSAAPSLVLVEGRRGGRPGLKIEAPLVISEREAPS